MKLLFDQNLSPRLVESLGSLFPGSLHVRDVGLHAAPDEEVWRYAAGGGFTIDSKDADFHPMSFLFGHPPKVVWIRLGNCSTAEIEAALRSRREDLSAFGADPEGAFLVLK